MTSKERAVFVGERIVSARKRKGMSQVKLAKALADLYNMDAETMRRSLGNNERGEYAPRLQRLEAIAQITGVDLDYFTVDGVDAPFQEAI